MIGAARVHYAARRRGGDMAARCAGADDGKDFSTRRRCRRLLRSSNSVRSIVLPELAKAGIAEGRNLIFDARAGSMEQLPGLARDLIASNPDAVAVFSASRANSLRSTMAKSCRKRRGGCGAAYEASWRT